MLNPAQQRDPAHLTADQSGLNDFSVVLCDHIPCSHKMSSSDKARSQLIVHCDVCVLHLFAVGGMYGIASLGRSWRPWVVRVFNGSIHIPHGHSVIIFYTSVHFRIPTGRFNVQSHLRTLRATMFILDTCK